MHPRIRLFAIPLGLFVWQLLLLTALRFSLDSHPIFTFEEAGSSILSVLYFARRLEVCQVTTNIASYLIFWIGFHLTPDPGVTYGRAIKSIVMATIPVLTYLLLHRRMGQPRWFSVLTSVATGLIPAVFYYSVLAVDMAMDLPFGLLAIYFAYGNHRFSPFASGLTLAFSALAYGSGLAFGPPVLYLLWRQPRRSFAISSALLAGLLMALAAAFYWTNTQVLFLGGGSGGAYFLRGAKFLTYQILFRGESYYFTLPGLSAMGVYPIGFLAVAGLCFGLFNFRVWGVWLMLAIASFLVGSASGVPFGIRRSVPMAVALVALNAAFIQAVLGRLPWRYAPFVAAPLCMAVMLLGPVVAARHWLAGEWIPADYRFPLTQPTFDASLEDYRLHFASPPIPDPTPALRMTYGILNLLTGPDPVVTFEQTASAPDTGDAEMPLFPQNAPRFSLWRDQIKRLSTPKRVPEWDTPSAAP